MGRDRHSRAAGSADPSASRDVAVGRLLHEYLERRACGQAESQADFLAAHPELADELRLHLGLVRSVFDGGGTLHGLIHQGVLRASADPRFPAELGPYRISALLGRGGMGIVLCAHEESLNRRVALKILRPDLGDDPVALARFTREAKAAAGLRHPNIVDIHAVGRERGVHYLAMEYIDGPTLAEVLRRATDDAAGGPPDNTVSDRESLVHDPTAAGLFSQNADRPSAERTALPADVIRTLFRQLLSGLAAAHRAGLVHRDIKSSNLLLDFGTGQTGVDRTNPATATLKIADFGLARMVLSQTRLTMEAKTLGTPEYMSPEQARGDEAVDHRADLYSAGVVLYEMLTGRTPFRDATPTGIMHRILHDEPPHPRAFDRGADPALASLALRLMAKRPEDRFATAEEALAALDAGTAVRSRERRRRWRRRMLVAGGGLAAMTALALWVSDSLEVTAVRVDPDFPTRVLATYGGYRALERTLIEFPQSARRAIDPQLVDVEGDGRADAVFVATGAAMSGKTLFRYSLRGSLEHQWDLSDRAADLNGDWPDVETPAEFAGALLAKGDLDGQPGEEIVAVAHHGLEYPAHVAVIDSQSNTVRAGFWHFGHISSVQMLPQFLNGTDPAILLTGLNNKLDGFRVRMDGDDPRRSHWDKVPFICVLDLRNMEGIGPPRTRRIPELSAARVHAYAFLDLPGDIASIGETPGQAESNGTPDATAAIDCVIGFRVNYSPRKLRGKKGRLLDVYVKKADDARQDPNAPCLTLDEHLRLCHITSNTASSTGDADSMLKWRRCWKRIIEDGRYLEEDTMEESQHVEPAASRHR